MAAVRERPFLQISMSPILPLAFKSAPPTCLMENTTTHSWDLRSSCWKSLPAALGRRLHNQICRIEAAFSIAQCSVAFLDWRGDDVAHDFNSVFH